MYGRVEVLGVKFHRSLQALTKEEIDEALLGSGYSGLFHNVPNLYPRPRLPDELIAGPGVLSPRRSVEVRARVGNVVFSIVNEKTVEYVLTHLDEEYRHSTDARFDHLQTRDGRRLYTWGQPPE